MDYQLIRETFPVARKPHRCIWCGEPIPSGTTYCREFSRYDGVQDHRWHLECRSDASSYFGESGEPEFRAYGNARPMEGQAWTTKTKTR